MLHLKEAPEAPVARNTTESAENERYIQSFYALVEQKSFAPFIWERVAPYQQKLLQQSLPQWLQEQAAKEDVDLPLIIRNVRLCGVDLSQAEESQLYRLAREADDKHGRKPGKALHG